MKTPQTLLIFILLFLSMQGMQAQYGYGGMVVPLNPQSPLFGKDIIIDNESSFDQHDVSVCCAFNGWLYAEVASYDSTQHFCWIILLRSTDNGISWDSLYGGTVGQYCRIRSENIAVIGDSISNIKVFMAGVLASSSSRSGRGFVYEMNGITGDYEMTLLEEDLISGVAITTDFNFLADVSNNGSLGILYSIHSNTCDSIIFISSTNGGMSINNYKVVAKSNHHLHNVSLNYGRSPSWSSGRVFAAWEEKASATSTVGHIYTSHSEPGFNSPFTTPICLDSLNNSSLNKVRNPSISCQFNNNDNNNGNLTELIMLEELATTGNTFDLKGLYNTQATISNHFNELTVSTSLNNKLHPSLNFDPFNSTFMLTYFDSTELKLPFLINEFNLANPNGWTTIDSAYNDNESLISPLPQVQINLYKQEGMNAWISNGNNGFGIALFDAPYSTYTGNPGITNIADKCQVNCFPNPCSMTINFAFQLYRPENVKLEIESLSGSTLRVITDQSYLEGNHLLKYDINSFTEGSYIYKLISNDFFTTGKFIVIHN